MAKEMLSQSKISLHSLRNDMLSVLVSKLEGSSKLGPFFVNMIFE